MSVAPDPVAFLRDPAPVDAYPAEPSDEALAEQLGIEASQLIRFDMNTMPLTAWAEYSDQAYARLRDALVGVTGVDADRIVPGAGADELIRLVTTQVVAPGDAVVIPTPTFAMFAVEARIAGARVVEVPRAGLAVRQPPEALREAVTRERSRLIWICSPNNPTGDRYELDEIRALASGLDALVVADEVYLEFAVASLGTDATALSAIALQDELPNVLVLRSLSKAYGMAAIRIGYLVASRSLADRFGAVRLPLAISGPAEQVALEVLADPARAESMRADVVAQRARLEAVLTGLGCDVLPSVANFVTFRPPDATALADRLDALGLVLRRYGPGPLDGWLRVTARPASETDRMVEALEALLAGTEPATGGRP